MTALADRFEQESGHRVTLIFGSTGKLFAQIGNGAPFDAFFAADAERPRLLENAGLAVPGSRFTYAVGKLALWSPQQGLVDTRGEILRQGSFRHLAIANPKLAPYGAAAREVMKELGVWERMAPRLVRGENIAQAYQFVKSGNAELGFVAWSQLASRPGMVEGSHWLVPPHLHRPVEQQAVRLSHSDAVISFFEFMLDERATSLIRSMGYETP